MRRRVAVIVGGLAMVAATARADPKADIVAQTKAAMASYDAMDYAAARTLLYQALALAKKSKLEHDPIVARAYLDLAITQLASSDLEAAKLSLLSAAQIDPKIAIDPAYKSPELVKLLDEAKATAAAIAAPGVAPSTADRGGAGPAASSVPAGSPADETEDPIRGAARGRPGVGERGAARRFAIEVSGGTGVGYLTGKTEGNNDVRTCCLGASGVVLGAELGYRVTPRLTLGAAARLGLPLGADLPGHATLAPAGFVRARYGLTSAGDGLRVMAELGGGLLRSTLDVDGRAPGDAAVTDIVAQGPLLVGAGLGYTRRVAGDVAVGVELAAIAGLAIVDHLGGADHLNTGVSADLSVGAAFAF